MVAELLTALPASPNLDRGIDCVLAIGYACAMKLGGLNRWNYDEDTYFNFVSLGSQNDTKLKT
jgi:hypothetical protein